jgi:hypothetical protein
MQLGVLLRLLRGLLLVGAVACFVFALALFRGCDELPGGEYPIAGASGIAVDTKGNVYVGLPTYGAVQAYDPQGRFLWATRINAAFGAFDLHVTDDSVLEAATNRNRVLYRLSSTGEILGRQPLPQDYPRSKPADWFTVERDGTSYHLRDRDIVRVGRDGAQAVLVSQPAVLDLPVAPGFLVGLGICWVLVAIFLPQIAMCKAGFGGRVRPDETSVEPPSPRR